MAPFVRRATTLVAIADFEIREYGRLLGVPKGRFVKIPNGADLPQTTREPRPNGTLIISVGRLERYKGHRLVLKAFPEILRQRPEALLWIAGAGPDELALRAEIKRLGLSDRVELGAAERPELAARLKGASVLVLLSDFESHPLAVLEAAALGVPAVVADNSGMAELAQRGLATAVALDAGPQRHASAIVSAMTAPRPMPRTDIPTWHDCAAGLASLYRRIVDHR